LSTNDTAGISEQQVCCLLSIDRPSAYLLRHQLFLSVLEIFEVSTKEDDNKLMIDLLHAKR